MGSYQANRSPGFDAHSYTIRDVTGLAVAIHIWLDGPDGKRFRWTLPDGTSGLGGLRAVDLPLYGIDQLTAESTVLVVEGEKCAEALWSLGIQAVGTVTGAGTIPSVGVLGELSGRCVQLWPDNDAPGRKHMDQIAKALTDIAASVEILEWVDAPDHGDAGDFQALGHVASEVLALPIHPAPLRDVVRAERILGTGHVPIRSAQTRSQSGAELELPFRTAREFASETAPEVDWIAGRYVAAGAITQVEGKIKSAGKTTLVTHLCRAVLTGSSFLGEPTRRTAVVYLTEQTGASLREALRRADLLERDDFVFLSWAQVPAVSWPDLVAAVAAECGRREAQLLVVDTLSRFAGIRGDGENSAGEADAAMAPLQLAAAQGLGIILVRHERKAGGDVGDAGRGSSAFGGAVDILVAVRRLPGDGPANRRTLQALSRFDETPDLLIVELTDSGYVALGDEMAVARAQAQAEVLEFLADAGAIGCRMDDLVTPNRPRTTVQRVLDELVEAADVARLGKGVKGHPFRFALTELLEAAAPVVKEAPTAESLLPGIEGLAELFRNLGSDIDALGELQ